MQACAVCYANGIDIFGFLFKICSIAYKRSILDLAYPYTIEAEKSDLDSTAIVLQRHSVGVVNVTQELHATSEADKADSRDKCIQEGPDPLREAMESFLERTAGVVGRCNRSFRGPFAHSGHIVSTSWPFGESIPQG